MTDARRPDRHHDERSALEGRGRGQRGRIRASLAALIALLMGTLAAVVPGVVTPADAVVGEPRHYVFPGGLYTYAVPDGVTQLAVTLAGGGGGPFSGGEGEHLGGYGGKVDAVIPVSPGDQLEITVGGSAYGHYGGFGGGGDGGEGGGGGGGTSSVVLDGSPLLVAGGGGGGSSVSGTGPFNGYIIGYYPECDTPAGWLPGTMGGGNGGGLGTPNGTDGCRQTDDPTGWFSPPSDLYGRGATVSAPGEGRGDGWGFGSPDTAPTSPDGDIFGFGGDGQDGVEVSGDGYFGRGGDGNSVASANSEPAGGGGGGGYNGGGGGVWGGGGGSSYATPEATHVEYSLNSESPPPGREFLPDGFVIITPIVGSSGGGEPSDDCKANGGERVVDNTTQGVLTMMYVDQPASGGVEVCVRVEDSSGDGFGGKLALTPGGLDPGVSGEPSTDGDAGACTTTAPNQVPGSHPMSSGGVGPVDYMIDAYANSAEAWVCLEVTPGTNTRVKIPLGAPGVSLGNPFTWYPDDGTPG